MSKYISKNLYAPCVVCGTIIKKTNNKKTCSVECRKINNKENLKRYRAENKEKLSKENKKYRESHREELNEYLRDYRANNKDSVRKTKKKYYQKNKEGICKKVKIYCANNKDKVLKWSHEKRARKIRATVEDFQPVSVFIRDGYRCQHCNKKTRPDFSSTHALYPNLDHIIPLSKGGEHSKQNTQCLCRGCNIAKSANGEGLDQLILIS